MAVWPSRHTPGRRERASIPGVSEPQPLFQLGEYVRAVDTFVVTAVRAMMRVHEPFLAEVRSEVRESIPTGRVQIDEQVFVDQPPLALRTSIREEIGEAVEGRFESFYSSLYESARDSATELMRYLFESVHEISEATGNVVSAHGKPFDYEVILDVIEKVRLEFDADDRPVLPTIFLPPDAFDRISALPPPTEEQQRHFDELIERKREEFHARRPTRKLS
jgi:hypothetical protein